MLIVAEHTSARFGGEAILPLHYFRVLRARQVETWMITHARTREELAEVFPEDLDRIHFIRDSAVHRLLWRIGQLLPEPLERLTAGWISRIITQLLARKHARRLVVEHAIDVVHQPIPVSPKEPSFLFRLGAPVVIGPMNGGMTFPPMFRDLDHWFTRLAVAAGRSLANLTNRLIPGKIRAATLLVANQRTAEALPKGIRGRVVELVENGVDLSLWSHERAIPRCDDSFPTFAYLGRLVELKAVDILLEAVARVPTARLLILGDGPERQALEELTSRLGLEGRVEFAGWVPQAEAARRLGSADALVLASLHECGGAVVLEAMASGLPVVASKWGGPSDYLDESCGILVNLTCREEVVASFAAAMSRLSSSRDLCRSMGRRGRKKVEALYDWEKKVDRILEVYCESLGGH